MSTQERRFHPAEVREILRRAEDPVRATDESSDAVGLSERELIDTARDVGYDEQRVRAALVRYEADRALTRHESEALQQSRRAFTTHLLWYAGVNGLFTAFNLSVGGPRVFLGVLLTWGFFLLLHLRAVLFPDPDKLRKRAQKRLERERLQESGQRLGKALSRGASELMDATARRLEDHLDERALGLPRQRPRPSR